MKIIDFEKFLKDFKPYKNKFDENASYDGRMFDTIGEELKEVNKHNNNFIWTLVDCDDELQYIIPGKHLVNRAGFFICKNPWSLEEIEVDVNEKCHINKAKYVCMEFLEENGLLTTEIEDKLHDYWNGKF